MIATARLAFDLALPTEEPGAYHMPTADREGVRGWELFERAVGGFYDVVLSPQGWRVSPGGRNLRWQVAAKSAGIDEVLPSMFTDIELKRPAEVPGPRLIVIDTKFTSILTPGQHRKQTVRSGHIYQMYAYLMSQERDDDSASLDSSGVLLHPSVGENFDEHALIQGHEIRFATVDLAADSREIRRQLLRIPFRGCSA